MLNKFTNNNGFTLIEILASIVLLTVVISLFLSIFPQMGNMNQRNGDNLKAANVGKEVLVLVKKDKFTQFSSNSTLSIKTTIPNLTRVGNTFPIIYKGTYKNWGESFFVQIRIEGVGELQAPSDFKQFHQLHQVRIDVDSKEIQKNSKSLTTTYGYIEEVINK